MKANITINTGITSNTEAEITEDSNTEYKVTSKEEKKTLKVERLAKKNEGVIQDLVQESSEHEEKITKHEQDIDTIKDQVSSVTDYKREVEGITEIHLENASKAQVLILKIEGNQKYESNLFPSDELFPSDNLYPNQEVL